MVKYEPGDFTQLIIEWRTKLFSVQTTIAELLQELEVIENHESLVNLLPKQSRKRCRRSSTRKLSTSSEDAFHLEGIPTCSEEMVTKVLVKEEVRVEEEEEQQQQQQNGWPFSHNIYDVTSQQQEHLVILPQEKRMIEETDLSFEEDNYSTHYSISTNSFGKVHRCQECERIFTRSGSLNRHIKSVHRMVRYPCDQCEYRATEMGSLRRHMKLVHKLAKSKAKLAADLIRQQKKALKRETHVLEQQGQGKQPEEEQGHQGFL